MPAAPPAATPAAPAAPAKSAAPAAPPSIPTAPEREDVLAESFADLDAIDQGKEPPKREAAKSPPSERAKSDPSDADSAHSADKDDAGSGTTKEPEDGSAKDAEKPSEPKPVKAKELREAYEKLKGRVSGELEPKIRQLETKVREYESTRTEAPEALTAEMETIKKRNTELERHIRFVDFQKSKEYQEGFWQPYVKAWNNAVRELKGLTMKVEDPATGETTSREVTEADLQYFASLDPAARRQEINRLFPEDKEEVKRHINEISRLFDASQDALKKAKEEGETHAKAQAEKQQLTRANRAKLWKGLNDSLAAKYPQWFAPAENDTDGNSLLERGQALADLAFSPHDLTPERVGLLPKSFQESITANKPFTQEQLVRLHSIVRNKAANHDRIARQLDMANQKITELEKSLSQYEKSSPDGVPAGGGTPKTKTGNFMEEAYSELDALDK